MPHSHVTHAFVIHRTGDRIKFSMRSLHSRCIETHDMTLRSPEPPVHRQSSFPPRCHERRLHLPRWSCGDPVSYGNSELLHLGFLESSLIELSGVWLRYGWAYLGCLCPRVHSYTAIRVDILASKSPIPSGQIGSILFLLSVAFRYVQPHQWHPCII